MHCGFEHECKSFPDCQGCPWEDPEEKEAERKPTGAAVIWPLLVIAVLALASVGYLIYEAVTE